MQRCLDVVAAYRASGQKGKAWAQANGVPERVAGELVRAFADAGRRGWTA